MKPVRLLVVDDHALFRSGLISLLKDMPEFQVVGEACNGREALEAARQLNPDVVLLDVNMPVMDGEEMINRLRQNPATSDLPIIIVSTEGSESRKEVLKQKGARFVHKPFTPETLRDAILRTLGGLDEQKAGDGTL